MTTAFTNTLSLHGMAAITLFLALAVSSHEATAIVYTYTGGGTDADDWQDTGNWSGGANYPGFAAGDDAVIPDGFGPSFTNVPSSIQKITTGDTLVTVNNGGTLSFAGTSAGPRAGSGGLTFTAALSFINGGAVIEANVGTLTGTSTTWGNTGIITQTAGGTFDFSGTFTIPNPSTNISNWQFINSSPTLFSASFPSGSYTFTGTPTFGGHRPNWGINGTSLPGGNQWDLNGQTIFGNTVTVNGGGGGPTTRHGYLTDNVGGTIDANVLQIGTPSYLGGYLNLHDTQVTLRGSGTIYNNQSLNNDGTDYSISGGNKVAGSDIQPAFAFNIDDGTTFVFDPAAGTANVDTGSEDQGVSGFSDNFAFNNVTIATGDTITLTGNANVGSGDTALYLQGTLEGEDGAALALNTRNAYVAGGLNIGSSPGIFTVSDGDLFLTSTATATFELAGPVAGTGYDQLVLSGSGTLHLGDATLDLDLQGAPDGLYFLVDNQTPNAIDGIFAGLLQGDDVFPGNSKLLALISYEADLSGNSFLGGNDIAVQLVAVPEPGTITLLALGFAAVVGRRRRRS